MGWDKVGRGAGREILFFFPQYCYFLTQHRCSWRAAKPSGQQKSSQGSEWTLESKTGESTAVGGHGEKLSMVSKEAEKNRYEM